MDDSEFITWCENNGVEIPSNNSDLLDREMTIGEFFYLLHDCFMEGRNTFKNF